MRGGVAYSTLPSPNTMGYRQRKKALANSKLGFFAYLIPFSDRIAALFDERLALLEKCKDTADLEEEPPMPKDIQYSFNDIAGCSTPCMVHTFIMEMLAMIDERPQFRQSAYRRLIAAVENEILIDYLRIFYSLPERTRSQEYIPSLLTALAHIIRNDYVLDLLYYGAGTFQVISAGNLLQETSIEQLREKLRIMNNSMADMTPKARDWFTGELKQSIPKAVIRRLGTPDVDIKLPDDVFFCIRCLDEIEVDKILAAVTKEDTVKNADPVEGLLGAQGILQALCADKDIESLRNSWQKFLNCAASCPDFALILEIQAQETLSNHIMASILKLSDTPMPETMQCLIRLHTALTIAPNRISYDDELFSWVLLGQKI